MTSLGFSEYAENNNDSTRNGNGNGNGNSKIYNRRNGGGGGNGNRTLKIPRNIDAGGATPERGLLQSPNGAISGITNENGNNNGMIQQAGKKIKQIKDYIENIHRKGGEDSDDDGGGDMDNNHILPSYPAQGMGVYATNVSNTDIIRGVSSNTPPFTGGSETVVRKTTQMNSLHPGSSYSSTLLEGMNVSPTPYFEKVTGIPGAPKRDATAGGGRGGSGGAKDDKTSTYASQYYEQFVPYAESLAGQLANNSSGSSGSGGGNMSGTNAALIEKLNYIIHMLEEKKEEKTGHVIEELVLYCFLGVFIIFVVDTFTRAANVGRVGGGRGTFSMFGGGNGSRRYSHTASVYQR
jgi:hypothetical protein